MEKNQDRKAYIIGGGIAGLATAVFLLEDVGFKGGNITVFEGDSVSGGSLDGQGSADQGYLCRGYRLFEKSVYLNTLDLFSRIPSLMNPGKTLKNDFLEFNHKVKIKAKARLMKNGQIVDAHHFGLKRSDQFRLLKLLVLPEKSFQKSEIRDYFSPDFFQTNFWSEWATTFAFEPWHSLLEMKRYACRFIQDFSSFDTMSCVLVSPYNEYDFIVSPLETWLLGKGVNLKRSCPVTDIEFKPDTSKKIVTGLSLKGRDPVSLEPTDLVFLTTGTITADSCRGTMEKAPVPIKIETALWDLWKKASKKFADLGDPAVFYGSVGKTKLESFTITFNNPIFFALVEKISGNKAGTGGAITFKNSNWFLSVILPFQPFFVGQPQDTFVCLGYGLEHDRQGNHIKKKMSDCSGREIVEELCFHLGFADKVEEILKGAVCLPVMMPFITSQFSPRKKADRPKVVPDGSVNFACIGQYVEIPKEIVFTVEYSVRSAKMAVKKLLNLPVKIPPVYQGQKNPRHLLNAIKTILR